jgi:hypothetical protein
MTPRSAIRSAALAASRRPPAAPRGITSRHVDLATIRQILGALTG